MPQFPDGGSRGPGRGCGLLGSPSDLGVAPGPWAPSALLVFALDTEPLVQSLGYTPSPRPPPLPHKGLLSLPWPPGGDLSPSILALSLAPGPGAIRSARPRAGHKLAGFIELPTLPRCLPPLPTSGRSSISSFPAAVGRPNMTARRGQSGHSLRRSRGGSSAQFSWFQGGFVRPLFITACGEISFIKMVRLGGVTLLTTCWKNITPPFWWGCL